MVRVERAFRDLSRCQYLVQADSREALAGHDALAVLKDALTDAGCVLWG